MTTLLAGPTWLLGSLPVLLIVILCGPERIYQRMLGLLRVLRPSDSHHSDAAANPSDTHDTLGT